MILHRVVGETTMSRCIDWLIIVKHGASKLEIESVPGDRSTISLGGPKIGTLLDVHAHEPPRIKVQIRRDVQGDPRNKLYDKYGDQSNYNVMKVLEGCCCGRNFRNIKIYIRSLVITYVQNVYALYNEYAFGMLQALT
ncbi:hypothetical protein WN51_01003 [Melipona quadrifasciata]|uniref:Uncharacterized protein n=1 Tax=Melipona quadrifasciata TaxID=166423 RepID=A0A0N0BEN5_9HYME|nr:hypothetical protein WN51_01003 [Melipona quadrifasciata]